MAGRLGEVLDGKYRLDRLLGSGGMGSVFAAEHVVIGRRVAVKILHPEYAGDPTATRRFLTEARAAAAIGHESIVDIFDIGTTTDDAPYLVMELLEGESLRTVLKRRKTLAIAEAVSIMLPVLSALAAAHRRGVLHRDVKPDNVFLLAGSSAGRLVKLLDFGVSKITWSMQTNETRAGVIVGTPAYMAPEQACGRLDLDHRCDLYAASVTLYEALTGRLPHSGRSAEEILAKVVADEPTPPRRFRPSLSPELEAVILRALDKDREKRHQSAEELADAITGFLDEDDDGETIASGPAAAISFHEGPTAMTGIDSAGQPWGTVTGETEPTSVDGRGGTTGTGTFARSRLPGPLASIAATLVGAGAVVAWFMLSSPPDTSAIAPAARRPSPPIVASPTSVPGPQVAPPPTTPPVPAVTPSAAPIVEERGDFGASGGGFTPRERAGGAGGAAGPPGEIEELPAVAPEGAPDPDRARHPPARKRRPQITRQRPTKSRGGGPILTDTSEFNR